MARRASKSLALGASFMLIAAGAAACAEGQETREYRQICTNPSTQERIADKLCERNADNSYLGYMPVPYYYPSYYNGSYPGVGQRVSGGGLSSIPKGKTGIATKIRKNEVKVAGGNSGPKAVKGGTKSFSSSKTISRGGGFGGGSKGIGG